MTFFTAHNLVSLVALSCKEDSGALRSREDGGTDSLPAVFNHNGLCKTLCGEAGLYFINYGRWHLRAGVVGRNDKAVGKVLGNLCHLRALCAVTVSAAAKQAYELPLWRNCAESLKHILQGVRGVGVVYDNAEAPWTVEVLKPSRSRLQGRKRNQSLLRLCSKANRSRVDGKKVIGVVLANEAAPHLRSVHLEEHSVKTLLHNAGGMIGQPLHGIGHYFGRCILHHHAAVLVVSIDKGNGL